MNIALRLRSRRRLGAAAAVLVGTAIALSGCGSTAAQAVTKKVPLIVYAAEGYDANTVAAFQAKTGIPTQLVDDSTGPLLARIQAQINNPQWGLLWVDGDEAFAALDKQHYLVRGFEPKAAWTAAALKVVPSDQSYIPTGFTAIPAVVYNSQVVSAPPTNWLQLLQPQWQGAVGMNNPAVSGPTYPFVAGMMQYLGGVSQGESYFQQLKNNGLKIFPTNKPTLAALIQGQIKLALVQNSAGLGAAFQDSKLKLAYLDPVTLLPSVIGIDGKASKQEQLEAEEFVNFVFSAAGQHQRLIGDPHGDSLFWPAVKGYSQLSAVPPFSSIPYQVLNAYTWGPREASIDEWFSNNIVA
ncbi:MAG: extracellular solute-binding protein [Candidatus Dormibacteria bacterium]